MAGNCTSAGSMEWDCPQVPVAIAVALGAGLATGVGGAIVFFPSVMRAVSESTLLAVSLALSAGVMLYVSFIEIFVKVRCHALHVVPTPLSFDTRRLTAYASLLCSPMMRLL